MKKYELTDIRNGYLRRIRALRDIPRYGIKAGDLGGWVETKNNLSHEGDCWIGDNAWVSGHARVDENAWVGGNAVVSGKAFIHDNARVDGNAWVDENACLEYDAQVKGNAQVSGNARVAQHGVISSTQDYFVVGPIGSRNGHTTFYRTASDIWVCCGCFNGSIDEFAENVRDTHGNNRYAQEYMETIDCVKSVFERRSRYDNPNNPHA